MKIYPTWTEISPEKAIEIWNTHSIYAYDESLKVDWQLNPNDDSPISELNEAVENGCVIFVENQF